MSNYLPDIAWRTEVTNVIPTTDYHYKVTLSPLDINEPGADGMQKTIGDWLIDFEGYPFQITSVVTTSEIEVYDVNERMQGIFGIGPTSGFNGYIYRPKNGVFLLSQAKLRFLAHSAPDVIRPIENAVLGEYISNFANAELDEDDVVSIVNNNININAYDSARLGGEESSYYLDALTALDAMFELVPNSGNPYIRAKLDFLGDKGITAYATGSLGSIWDDMPVATPTTLGGVMVSSGSGLKMTGSQLQIDGDTFNLSNYYNKTDSDARFGRKAFENTWAENNVFSKNVTINGNLYVNGTEFIANTQTVQIEDNLAIINYGEVGAGITAGFAGWEVDRGTADNFRFGFAENPGYFQVGKIGALQTVATREDSPTANYYAKWNNTTKRFDTALPTFSEIQSKPTTISGYGITDVFTKTESDLRYGQLEVANIWTTANLFSTQIGIGSSLNAYTGFAQNAGMAASEYVLAKITLSANSSNSHYKITAYVQESDNSGVTIVDLNIRSDASGGINTVKFHQEKDSRGRTVTVNIYKITGERSVIVTITPNSTTQNWGYRIEALTRHTNTITRQTSVLLFSAHADYANRSTSGVTEYVAITKGTASYTVNGNIVATGEVTAYHTSDVNLKKNITPIHSSLDLIDRLNPVAFRWNEEAKRLNPAKDDRINYGVIAQELEEVMPELIHRSYEKYKAVDYIQLIPHLVGAIKELRKEIKQLKR